ncbi:MAG: hypothetical protein WBF03_20125 [Xanthobacteraceae bacterium]
MSFRRHDDANISGALFGTGFVEGGQEISDRVHFAHDAHWQADSKRALDAQHQFRSAEAIDAEIAIKPAGERNIKR